MSGRDCGGCTLCCKVLGIKALEKPKGRWCPHCKPGEGCGAYETRPEECRTFNCLWLQREHLGPEWRPDRAKFVMCPTPDNQTLLIQVDPGAPDAWKRQPYHATLRDWSRAAVEAKRQIVVMVGDRATVVLPDRDVALGVMAEGERIVFRLGPDGRVEAAVQRGAG